MRPLRSFALFAGLLALACASPPVAPDRFVIGGERAAEETAPLGGESLSLRKREMRRAHRDMSHFLVTLEGLRHRSDRSGQVLFSQYLDAYMGTHLDELLAAAWQSKHPELVALDANLRLAKADVLIQMRETRRAQQVLDEIDARFAGREALLVEYPLGSQTTLEQAVKNLRERKWRG